MGLIANELLELFESFFAEKFQEGAGFSTWNDQSIDLVELLWLLDKYNFSTEFLETAAVGVKVSLKGQDSDFHVFGWYVDLRFTLVSFDITGEFDSAVFLGAITHRMGRRTLPTRHRRRRWLSDIDGLDRVSQAWNKAFYHRGHGGMSMPHLKTSVIGNWLVEPGDRVLKLRGVATVARKIL